MKKNISILGSTGSIGDSTLDVCRRHAGQFQVLGLSAGGNVQKLFAQIKEFNPQVVSVAGEAAQKELVELVQNAGLKTEVLCGTEGAIQVATLPDADTVISAIVGAAGLQPTLAAIQKGKTIGLANKESMVISGELMSAEAQKHNVKILPVDSEHSAIFQCLDGEHPDDIHKLVLTASGGPFLHKPKDEFASITKEQALKHPNWDMGAKITIDSASMMNKGLEVMEAQWLFNMPIEKIDVVVHPQSIVHSMVDYIDGSVIAHMGEPDMRVPIAYALSYPRRIKTGVKNLDLPAKEKLTFFKPDLDKFKCLKLAFDVAKQKQSFPPVLNAANEEVVAAFLNDQLQFVQIPDIIDACLQKHSPFDLTCIEDVLEADRWSRSFVQDHIARG